MKIKVRAWDKKNRRMLYPDAIWLKHQEISIEGCFYKDVILMLFTGLTDKNGKEIYEKDIVKFYNQVEYITGYIAFDHGVFCLKTYNPDEACYNPWTFRAKEVEVIGNVWENPNLLWGSKDAKK